MAAGMSSGLAIDSSVSPGAGGSETIITNIVFVGTTDAEGSIIIASILTQLLDTTILPSAIAVITTFTTQSTASSPHPSPLVTPFSGAISSTIFQTSTSYPFSTIATSTTTPQPSTSTVPFPSLTTGAKAGIAIGTIFGAIVLMLLGAVASSCLQRRRRHSSVPQDAGDMPGIERETWDEKLKRKFSRKKLDGNGFRPELEGSGVFAPGLSRKELDGTHWKRELEGDTPKGGPSVSLRS